MSITPANRSTSDVTHITSIDQLSAGSIRELLLEAGRIQDGGHVEQRSFSAALMFLQPSLRTRLGFAEAVRRLGGVAHVITSRREIADGGAVESLRDALRVAGGLCDIVVVRSDGVLADSLDLCSSPLVSAGDDLEHP